MQNFYKRWSISHKIFTHDTTYMTCVKHPKIMVLTIMTNMALFLRFVMVKRRRQKPHTNCNIQFYFRLNC